MFTGDDIVVEAIVSNCATDVAGAAGTSVLFATTGASGAAGAAAGCEGASF